jgi:membrane dipeptidase
MGIEGGYAIENSLYALREFHRLGVRYMTLTHSVHNDWADSSGMGSAPPKPVHHGLTPFGEEVVREMQRIGMLVDVSHVSDETIEDVLRVAKAPVIASHSSARALLDAPRNLSDGELRAIAQNGGVVMVNFFSGYLDPTFRAAAHALYEKHAKETAALEKGSKKLSELSAAYRKLEAELPKPPLSVLIDHIEHIAQVAGVDHVGLGSDYDGVSAMPDGLEGIDGLPKITLELLRRGWSDQDVKKVLGENFLRVMSAAEAYAHSTATTLSGDGSTKAME